MMVYEPKDNAFSLFRNERKEKDSHPDYRGDGMINGELIEVAAWLRKARDGRTFMSCTVKPKGGARPGPGKDHDDRPDLPFDDSIGF